MVIIGALFLFKYIRGSKNFKGNVPQNIFFFKSGHHGAIDLWNNSDLTKYLTTKKKADFALQNYGVFILHPHQLRSLHSLSLKIMEQCRFCPAKSQRHSFRGQNNNRNYLKVWLLVGRARYAGLLLAPVEGFGPLFALQAKKVLLCCFCLVYAIFGV